MKNTMVLSRLGQLPIQVIGETLADGTVKRKSSPVILGMLMLQGNRSSVKF